jgi:hypothetical protein
MNGDDNLEWLRLLNEKLDAIGKTLSMVGIFTLVACLLILWRVW